MCARHFVQLLFGLTLLISFICRSAFAEVINFDDLKRISDPESPYWADQPITDYYAGKGLVISDGYLNEYYENDENMVSGPNYIQGGPYLTFYFVGNPPKFVSLVVTSSNGDVVTLGAACGDGSVLTANTPGWAGPDNDTPFKAKNLITFASDHGISKIDVSAYYFLRTSAMIDDIIFHNNIYLPEPAPFLLLAIGLIALLMGRRRFQ